MTARSSILLLALALVAAALTACNENASVKLPVPHEVSESSVAEFCGMTLDEHPGPKGQIFVKALPDHPYWFASVRDTIAFTMLPEAPKDIAAIYVNDMGKAKNWAQPEPGTWVEARKAFFVIAGRKHGGMGEDEAVPFSDRAEAQRFMAEYGGKLVRFNEIPKAYILSSNERPLPTRYDQAVPEAEDGEQPGAVAKVNSKQSVLRNNSRYGGRH